LLQQYALDVRCNNFLVRQQNCYTLNLNILIEFRQKYGFFIELQGKKAHFLEITPGVIGRKALQNTAETYEAHFIPVTVSLIM